MEETNGLVEQGCITTRKFPGNPNKRKLIRNFIKKIGSVWFEFLASHDWLEYSHIWPKLTIELVVITYLIDDFKNETQFADIQAKLAWFRTLRRSSFPQVEIRRGAEIVICFGTKACIMFTNYFAVYYNESSLGEAHKGNTLGARTHYLCLFTDCTEGRTPKQKSGKFYKQKIFCCPEELGTELVLRSCVLSNIKTIT